MKVTLQLKGPLKKYSNDTDPYEMQIDRDSITVQELMKILKIPSSSISFILVDGSKAEFDTELRGGEVIIVNPRVAGG